MRLLRAKFLHTDERTGRKTEITKLISAFRNFVKTPQQVFRGLLGLAQISHYGIVRLYALLFPQLQLWQFYWLVSIRSVDFSL